MSPAAARQALLRLSQRVPPVVYGTKWGFYAATTALVRKKTQYDDFLWLGFHGIEAVADCHKLLGGVNRRIQLLVTTRFSSPTTRRNPANHSLVYDGEWDGLPMTIQLTTRKKIQVSLKASNTPLDALDFHAFLKTLLVIFELPPPVWRLSFDLNEDHEGHIDRVTDLSWRDAIGFVRIYWKKKIEMTRTEARDYRGYALEHLLPAVERVLNALMELEAA